MNDEVQVPGDAAALPRRRGDRQAVAPPPPDHPPMRRPPRRPSAAGLASALLLCLPAWAATPLQPDDLLRLPSVGDVRVAPGGQAVLVSVTVPDPATDTRATRWELVRRSADGTMRPQVLEGVADPQWADAGRRIFFVGDDAGQPAWRELEPETGRRRTLLKLPHRPGHLVVGPGARQVAFLAAVPLPAAAWTALPAQAPAEQKPYLVDYVPFRSADGDIVPNTEQRLFVGDLASGQVRELRVPDGASLQETETGGAWQPAWTADGTALIVSAARGFDARHRLWNRNRDLLRLPLEGGAPAWVVESPLVESDPKLSPDGRLLAFLRQRGAPEGTVFHNELVVHELAGGREWRPMQALDVNPLGYHWAPDGRGLLLNYAQRARTKLAHLALDGRMRPLADDVSGVDVAADGTTGALALRHDRLGEAVTLGPDGRVRRQWTDASAALAGRALSDLQEIDYPSAHVDRRPIHALVARPAGTADTRRLPVVVDLHGGPYAASNAYFNATREFYAGRGYVVVQPNYRGSIGYGDAFARLSDRRHYPGWYDRPDAPHEMGMDVVGALQAIAERGLGDPDRVYLRGCSAGALLTSWTLGRTRGFRAASAVSWYSGEWGAPFYGYYQPRQYFDELPWEPRVQPASYRRNVMAMVDRIHTPLLLIQGELDWFTPKEDLEKFYYALRTRREVAILYYPDEDHCLRRHPASQRNALLQEEAWFRKHGEEP